jgi:hypothetical protein
MARKGMALDSKTWTPVSMHEMVLAWLQAERDRFVTHPQAGLITHLLDAPDLTIASENRDRLRLLYSIRNLLMLEIPPDTQWYLVDSLTDAELDQLHAINHHEWTGPADNNELRLVAKRKTLTLSSAPSTWNAPILWGHDKQGPFTIIEGNKRLTAYAGSGQTGLNIRVLVGLSPLANYWHLPDRAGFLLQDMLQPRLPQP